VKLLLDINVVLDVALNRMPFVVDAALALAAIDRGRAQGYVAAHTVTTVFYGSLKIRVIRALWLPLPNCSGYWMSFPQSAPICRMR
jgi:hypothetical protein